MERHYSGATHEARAMHLLRVHRLEMQIEEMDYDAVTTSQSVDQVRNQSSLCAAYSLVYLLTKRQCATRECIHDMLDAWSQSDQHHRRFMAKRVALSVIDSNIVQAFRTIKILETDARRAQACPSETRLKLELIDARISCAKADAHLAAVGIAMKAHALTKASTSLPPPPTTLK